MQLNFELPDEFFNKLAAALAGHRIDLSASVERITDTETLNVAEAAKLLRNSEKHVRDLLTVGALKGFNLRKGLGGRAEWRTTRKDIAEFLKKKRV